MAMSTGKNNLVVEWSSQTTWHGVNDLFGAKNAFCKICWTLVLLSAMTMFSINIYAHLDDFFNGDTWISVTIYQKPKEEEKYFPPVVVCSYNQASQSSIKQMNMSLEAAGFIIDSYRYPNQEMDYDEQHTALKLGQQFEQYTTGKKQQSIADWSNQISQQCESLLLMCYMGSHEESGQFNCCDNVRNIHLPVVGRCFVLTVPRNVSEKFPLEQVGDQYGLHLRINTAVSDYAPYFEGAGLSGEAGLLFYIGYDPESTVVNGDPVAVEPGTRTWISMQVTRDETKVKKQKIPFLYPLYIPKPTCSNNSLSLVAGEYSPEQCARNCMAENFVAKCGCSMLTHVRPNVSVCDPISWFNCRQRLNAEVFSEVANCSRACLPSCYSHKIMLRASSLTYPIPSYIPEIQKQVWERNGQNVSDADIKEFSLVEIFFKSAKVKVVQKQERITVETLIANVGGILGVWAGISVITIYQAFVYICHFLFRANCSDRNRKNSIKL